jgi:hypothetical protein
MWPESDGTVAGRRLAIIGELQGTRPAAQDWRKAGRALGPAPPRCCFKGRIDHACKRWRGDGVESGAMGKRGPVTQG